MKRLVQNITTDYLEAAARLCSKQSRRRIVAYVESYDDVQFWRSVLSELENDRWRFEVMLPSRTNLNKGKRSAMMNQLGAGLGQYMIACVDADYDYLCQGASELSAMVCQSPYVFHTYAYAIENLQCYAPALHDVCVMATLNDTVVFDFEAFLTAYSRIIFPLLVWNVWAYRYGFYKHFNLTDMAGVVSLGEFPLQNAEKVLEHLARKVNVKIAWLQRNLPQAKPTLSKMRSDMRRLGVTEENAYLYMRGHDLMDQVVAPLVETACRRLRGERERVIREQARHQAQYNSELAGYHHAAAAPTDMLRKHTGYKHSIHYQRIQADIRAMLQTIDAPNAIEADNSDNYEHTSLL